MKWSTIQLQKFRDKGLQIDETVNLSDQLKQMDPEIRDVHPIHVMGRADISSEKVTFHLTISGSIVLPCSRTLVDVDYPIDIQTTETFLLKPSDYEREGDEELHPVNGELIDLTPVIQEIILLEVPMQVFSEEASDDQSLPSGNDWEVLTEEQVQQLEEKDEQKVDPRLAGLSEFFKQDKNS
ncbi:YceD family protein [Falsibacillus pallidus]|uniref:YceD family protein n=1 Tax=Falsibacillus pallidus TaxID=493781 RepID=UPI003D963917